MGWLHWKWPILAVAVLSLGLQSCSSTLLPLNVAVAPLKLNKVRMSAALVIPDIIRNGMSTQSVSCAGEYQVPIGTELETGMEEALSQIFDSVDVVTDRVGAMGNYDVLVEPKALQLGAEGHCLSRRFLYLTLWYYVFFSPIDTFDGHAELSVEVTDRQGQVLLTDTFKSKIHTKDALLQTANSKAEAVAIVLRESAIEAFRQMARGLAKSSQMTAYAQKLPKKPADRTPSTVARVDRFSDVDVLPKTAANAKNALCRDHRHRAVPSKFAVRRVCLA